jgi:hypothetical protein
MGILKTALTQPHRWEIGGCGGALRELGHPRQDHDAEATGLGWDVNVQRTEYCRTGRRMNVVGNRRYIHAAQQRITDLP